MDVQIVDRGIVDNRQTDVGRDDGREQHVFHCLAQPLLVDRERWLIVVDLDGEHQGLLCAVAEALVRQVEM